MSAVQWTTECLPHGSGQCDGTHSEGKFAGDWCGCPCHENLPADCTTTAAVKAWHDHMHGVTP